MINKMKKSTKALIAAVGAGAVGAAAAQYAYIFVRPPRITAKLHRKFSHENEYYVRRDAAAAALDAHPCTRHSITSARGETLQGFYYQSGAVPSKRIAFIVHGYHSDHLRAAGMFADFYFSQGIDIFCCDNVASGESGGRLIGYGIYESADCLNWLSYLKATYGEDIRVMMHGFSMGGATVLRMSDHAPDCVKCIVSDSGFSSAHDILYARIGALTYIMDGINRLVARYSINSADVRNNVRAARVPILFVHGREDMVVPFDMGVELYSICPGSKDYLWVDEARHVESIYAAPEQYTAKLAEFTGKYL